MYYELGTEPNGIATPALKLADIAWAEAMLWAPHAEKKGSTYYFYFPAIAKEKITNVRGEMTSVYRIGVASGSSPEGKFTAETRYISNAFSINPSVFNDNGTYYLIWGGNWGGQLHDWVTNNTGDWRFIGTNPAPSYNSGNTQPCRGPVISRLNSDMKSLAEKPREITIMYNNRRLQYSDVGYTYFEGPWLNKVNNKYYLSYSTGPYGTIALSESTNIYGPYTVTKILLPHPGSMEVSWTTHHSVVNFNNKWYIFYQYSDFAQKTHKRNLRFKEITFP